MKYSEINNLQVQELKKRLDQTKQALFDARMKHKMQRLSNMMELRDGRKDIARLRTALSALPESAFVSDKKADSVQLESKAPVTAKATAKKVPATVKAPAKEALAASSKTQASSEKKKEEKKLVSGEQKKIQQPDSSKKKSQRQTKKWFGFFGSAKKSSKEIKSGEKRHFFRRKSGGQ